MEQIVQLPKEEIDRIFEQAEHQSDYALGLYRAVYPQWDDIKVIKGWPKICKSTAIYIIEKAMAFDKVHHPDVMPGGLWMNKGFGSDETITESWIVRLAEFELN